MNSTGSKSDYTNDSNDLDVEAMVRKIMREVAIKSASNTSVPLSTVSEYKISSDDDNSSKDAEEKKKSSSRSKSKSKKIRKSKKSSSTKEKKKKNSKANKEHDKKISLIEPLLAELHNLKQEDASEDTPDYNTGSSIGQKYQYNLPSRTGLAKSRTLSDNTLESSFSSVSVDISVSTPSTATIGTKEFYNRIASKLRSHRNTICIQDAPFEFDEPSAENNSSDSSEVESVQDDDDFQAAFEPNDMRCLALVSHNEMKSTMKEFVIQYKNVLKKFRLTGTQSTMKMLAEVFADEPEIVFGPSCNSGPLGGDAELVALMADDKLGGILFFQDPVTSHPHQADIECLVRQAQVHNTVMATTPTTAMTIMEVFRLALMGEGKAELLPSFFFSLQSPTVEAYKTAQKKVVRSRSCLI